MIVEIKDSPDNVAAFRATGDIAYADFENTVFPAVKQKVKQEGELNYLLDLNTDLTNFSLGAWWGDTLLGLKNLSKWRRAAIVTDKDFVIKFTAIFSKVMPGEYKGFHDYEEAMAWVSEPEEDKE